MAAQPELMPQWETLGMNLRDFVRKGATFTDEPGDNFVVIEAHETVGEIHDGYAQIIPPSPSGPYAAVQLVRLIPVGVSEREYDPDDEEEVVTQNIRAEIRVEFLQGGNRAFDYCSRFITWAGSVQAVDLAESKGFSFELVQQPQEADDIISGIWENRFFVDMDVSYISTLRIRTPKVGQSIFGIVQGAGGGQDISAVFSDSLELSGVAFAGFHIDSDDNFVPDDLAMTGVLSIS